MRKVVENRIRKTVDFNADIHAEIVKYLDANPGVNFSFVIGQAALAWLKNPIFQARKIGEKERFQLAEM